MDDYILLPPDEENEPSPSDHEADLNESVEDPKRVRTKYHQYLTLVTSASKRYSHNALANSSEIVKQTLFKMFNKNTIPAALVKLPKVINDISQTKRLPKCFVEHSFPMLALDYKMHEPEEKYDGRISTFMEQFECPRTDPEAIRFAERFYSLQIFIQKSAELEACSTTSLVPKSMKGMCLRLKKPKKPNSIGLTSFMVKQSSVLLHCVDMRAYNIASTVNAYQIQDVIAPPELIDNELMKDVLRKNAFDANEAHPKKAKKEKKPPKSRNNNNVKRSKKCQRRRPPQPKKVYDPNASQNPVCLEEKILHGERATLADIESLKNRRLKPETARFKPPYPLTIAFCDTPWFRKQLKTGEHSKPIPLNEGRSRTGGKRNLAGQKFDEKAAQSVYSPIPIPVCLTLFPAANPWDDEYPENFDEYFEGYKQYVDESHKNYRSQEENDWKDYANDLMKHIDNPYSDHEVIRDLNLDEKGIISLSQELRHQALESDKALASLLQNATIRSQ